MFKAKVALHVHRAVVKKNNWFDDAVSFQLVTSWIIKTHQYSEPNPKLVSIYEMCYDLCHILSHKIGHVQLYSYSMDILYHVSVRIENNFGDGIVIIHCN